MPIVANLTPHESGLASWTEEDFFRALRAGKRRNGTAINPIMPWQAYAQMSDTEIEAMWIYLQTIPAVEKGQRLRYFATATRPEDWRQGFSMDFAR